MRFWTAGIYPVLFVFVNQYARIDRADGKTFRIGAPRQIDNTFAMSTNNANCQVLLAGEGGPEMAAIVVPTFIDGD